MSGIGPFFYHLTRDGMRVDGGLLSHVNSFFFNYSYSSTPGQPAWTPDPRNACGGHCRVHIYRAGECTWCNQSTCIQGTLRLSKTRIPSAHDESLTRFHKTMAAERTRQGEFKRHEFRTAFVTCSLNSRAEGAGVMAVDGPIGGLRVNVAPLAPPRADGTKRPNVVCSRGLYGYFPVRSIELFVNHYVGYLGFDHVIMYQMGVSHVSSSSSPVMRQLIESQRLILVDPRSLTKYVFLAYF